MSGFVPPRPRDLPLGKRLDSLLASKRGSLTAREAKTPLKDSAEHLGRSSSTEELLAEATRLDVAGVARVQALALKRYPHLSVLEESRAGYLGGYQTCWPEAFREAFGPPADAVYGAYRRVAGVKSSLDRYVRDSCIPTVGGWFEACPELKAAGELRLRAFSGHDYPVFLCRSCHRVQGWLGTDGHCEYCLWSERVAALMTSGRAFGWKDEQACFALAARYDRAAEAEYRGFLRGARQPLLFGRKRYQLERVNAWGAVVHDLGADWGPVEPEDGYRLWIPERFELESMDGSMLLLHFRATGYRWKRSSFERLSSHLEQAFFQGPTYCAADLDPEPLATAWFDFRLAVADINREEWLARQTASESRENATLAEADRRERLAGLRGAAKLLTP